jgi:hypothetical protein
MLIWPILALISVLCSLWIVIFWRTEEGVYALDPSDAGSGKQKGRGTFEPHNKNCSMLICLALGYSAFVSILTHFL